jgi:hypothetical protein
MTSSLSIDPIVGDWYLSYGKLFEVVAIDDDERILEVQHADGDLEEIDMDDWATRCRAGAIEIADPPEDSGMGTDHYDDESSGIRPVDFQEAQGLRANALEDLDLFE